MIEMFLPVIIVLALAYIFFDYKKMEKKRLQEELKKADERVEKNREKRKLEIEDKIESYYMKQLPKIYDRLSDKELMRIYDLLQRMHQNEVRNFFDDPSAEVKTEIYNSTAHELRKITGNSEWKHYCYDKEFCEFCSNIWDDPVAKWDMNYVYNLLCSRGVKNW